MGTARASNAVLFAGVAIVAVVTGVAIAINAGRDTGPQVVFALGDPESAATIGIKEMTLGSALEKAQSESGLPVEQPEGVPEELSLALVKLIPAPGDPAIPNRPAVQLRYTPEGQFDRALQIEFRDTRPNAEGTPEDIGVPGVEAEYLHGLQFPTWVASDGTRHVTLFYVALGPLAPTDDEVRGILASLFTGETQ